MPRPPFPSRRSQTRQAVRELPRFHSPAGLCALAATLLAMPAAGLSVVSSLGLCVFSPWLPRESPLLLLWGMLSLAALFFAFVGFSGALVERRMSPPGGPSQPHALMGGCVRVNALLGILVLAGSLATGWILFSTEPVARPAPQNVSTFDDSLQLPRPALET